MGARAVRSSMKSPRWESSSSPMGVSRETGSWETRRMSRTLSGVCSREKAKLLAVGLRPNSWIRRRCWRSSLLMVSTMCTGMRMVRAWSAMARVMAWRIHQVR